VRRTQYWMNVSLDPRIERAPGEQGGGDWMRIGEPRDRVSGSGVPAGDTPRYSRSVSSLAGEYSFNAFLIERGKNA